MPFFPDKNCLFIHIPKNAGSYIDDYLGLPTGFGLNDSPSDLNKASLIKLIKKQLFSMPFIADSSRKKDSRLFAMRKMLFGYFGGGYAFQHSTLEELISMRLVDDALLTDVFCFAIHRHPEERVKSIYKYWKFYQVMSFEEFCLDVVRTPWLPNLTHTQLTHLRPQIDFVKINGSIPDYMNMIPMDSLEQFFTLMHKERSWPSPRNKILNKSDSISIHVSGVARDIIQDRYHDDYRQFGYEML